MQSVFRSREPRALHGDVSRTRAQHSFSYATKDVDSEDGNATARVEQAIAAAMVLASDEERAAADGLQEGDRLYDVPSSALESVLTAIARQHVFTMRNTFEATESADALTSDAGSVLVLAPRKARLAALAGIPSSGRWRYRYVHDGAWGGAAGDGSGSPRGSGPLPASQAWLARAGMLVVDLSAGPCSHGVFGGEHPGTAGAAMLPPSPHDEEAQRADSWLGGAAVDAALKAAGDAEKGADAAAQRDDPDDIDGVEGQAALPRWREPMAAAGFAPRLAAALSAAVQTVLVPDVHSMALAPARKLFVPVVVFRDHEEADLVAEGEGGRAQVDVECVRREVGKLLPVHSAVHVVPGTHSLHDHRQVALALHGARRSDTVQRARSDGRFEPRPQPFVDAEALVEGMRGAADILAHGLLHAAALRVDPDVDREVVAAAAGSSSQGSAAAPVPAEGAPGTAQDGDSAVAGGSEGAEGAEDLEAAMEDGSTVRVGGRRHGAQPRPGQRRERRGAASGLQRHAWSIPDTRVIPVYVFSLARARWGGSALRFRDGGRVYAADDAVVVLAPLDSEEGGRSEAEAEAAEAGAAAAGVPFSDGRSGVPARRAVTLDLLAGLGQTVGGLVPPHRTWGGGAHYLWAMGHHPFAPFGHTPAFSDVRYPTARSPAPLTVAPLIPSPSSSAARARRGAQPRHGAHRLRACPPRGRHGRDCGLCGRVWRVRGTPVPPAAAAFAVVPSPRSLAARRLTMMRNQWDFQHGDDDPEYVTMHAQRYQSALSEPAWTDDRTGAKPSWWSSPVDRARYMLAEMMEQAETAPTPLALPVIRALHTDLEGTLRRVTEVGHLMAYGSPEEVHSQSLGAVQSALSACPSLMALARLPTSRASLCAAFRRNARHQLLAARKDLACCYVWHEPAPRAGTSLTRLVISFGLSLLLSVPLSLLLTYALPALLGKLGIRYFQSRPDKASRRRRRPQRLWVGEDGEGGEDEDAALGDRLAGKFLRLGRAVSRVFSPRERRDLPT